MAIMAARAGGIVCNHARERQSTAEQVSPIHSRNIELPARSIQKLSCRACRASAITSATNSQINTTTNTAGESQKSGRKNVGAFEAGDDDVARESDAAMAANN